MQFFFAVTGVEAGTETPRYLHCRQAGLSGFRATL